MRQGLVGLLVVALLAGCSTPELSGGGEPTSNVVEGAASSSATPTAEPSPVDENTTSEETADPEQANLKVTEYDYSTYTAYDDTTRASWGVVLTNPNDDHHLATGIDITVALLDGSGSVLTSVSDSLALILPGQSAAVSGSTMESVEGVAEMRVQARARSWERQDGPFPTLTTSDVNIRDGGFGQTVTGAMASTFSEDLSDVKATAILRDESGAILGGGFTFIDFVPAGADTTFEIMVDSVEGATSAEVYVNLSNLTLMAM